MSPILSTSWSRHELRRAFSRSRWVALALAFPACADPVHDRGSDAVVIAQETQAAWTRNFNPFLPNGSSRWPTRGGIYEPLLVHNRVAGAWVPWLADAWAWEDDGRALRFHVRHGVTWSDGTPFSADDVAFTFALLKAHPSLDGLGVWRWLAAVDAEGDEVVFRLARPFSPGLEDVAEMPIVPRHVWEGIADPLAWDNPDPVATGPYTEVTTFTSQVWELGRNPRYWQPGKPAVPTLRFPAFAGNDAANLALVNGEVDWAGNFVPAVDRTFVDRDPDHHLAWSPAVESTVFLYANTTTPPFDDLHVREALSLAIDRDRLVTVAMEGMTRPADASGLSDALATFRDPTLTAPWTRYDPEAAGRLLDAAGLPLEEGVRGSVGGAPLTVDLLVVAGWSDWIRAAQLVARDLGEVGVTVRVRTVDFSGWLDRVQRGDFALTIGWSTQGATPYSGYRDLMGSGSARPVGEASGGNWHRYTSPAADRLLAQVEATSDPEALAPLFDALQATFAAELPAIPLFPGPSWGVANTRRFDGFPTPEDPWVTLSPNRPPETLLVLTTLEPK